MWTNTQDDALELELQDIKAGLICIPADRDVDERLAAELFGAQLDELATRERQRQWDYDNGELAFE